MKVHGNAALGPAGRLALVQAIESGMTLRAAAAALNVAPATAHRWWHRWREASAAERRSGHRLRDRSSRPHRQPRQLTAAEEEPILRARREIRASSQRRSGLLFPRGERVHVVVPDARPQAPIAGTPIVRAAARSAPEPEPQWTDASSSS